MAEVLLRQGASPHAGRVAFSLAAGGERSTEISYAALTRDSLAAAAALRARGMRQGDRVLLCLGTGPELLHALFGVMLGGGVAVPVYPPLLTRGLRRWRQRAEAIARVSQPCGAVASAGGALHMASVLESVGGEDLFVATPSALRGSGARVEAARVLPEDLAFIQFTSGTTAEPRGVPVTHAALMANIRAMVAALGLRTDDVSVSWLPPYHDMGLVGHVFAPLYLGAAQHLMSPADFIRDPASWLELITRVGATQTTAPNFAFSMCVSRITEVRRAPLRLGSLRLVLNGAEQVQWATLEAFAAAFGPCGFSPEAFRPVYGLAEATLAATISPAGGPQVDRVDRAALAERGVARPSSRTDRDGQEFVAVGCPVEGIDLRILDAGGERCPDRAVGQVHLRGPSVMSGYYNNPQATAPVLRDGWLATGDLGYMARGQLHITGRQKELIIKTGRNLLPQDIEAACLEVAGLRTGRAVAFGLPNPSTGTEDVVLVAELRDRALGASPLLADRVSRQVHGRTGVKLDRLELVPPGALPRTSSGKLQRTAVRQMLERGELPRAAGSRLGSLVRGGVRSVGALLGARARRLLGW